MFDVEKSVASVHRANSVLLLQFATNENVEDIGNNFSFVQGRLNVHLVLSWIEADTPRSCVTGEQTSLVESFFDGSNLRRVRFCQWLKDDEKTNVVSTKIFPLMFDLRPSVEHPRRIGPNTTRLNHVRPSTKDALLLHFFRFVCHHRDVVLPHFHSTDRISSVDSRGKRGKFRRRSACRGRNSRFNFDTSQHVSPLSNSVRTISSSEILSSVEYRNIVLINSNCPMGVKREQTVVRSFDFEIVRVR